MSDKTEQTVKEFGIKRLYSNFQSELTLYDPVDLLVLKDIVKTHDGFSIELKRMGDKGRGECYIWQNEKKKLGFLRYGNVNKLAAQVNGDEIEFYEGAIPIIVEYIEKKYTLKPENKEKLEFILQGHS